MLDGTHRAVIRSVHAQHAAPNEIGVEMFVGSDLQSFARREKNRTCERFGRVGVVDALRANQWDPLESTCRHASLSIL